MNRQLKIAVLIIVLSFAISIFSYPYLPDKIASHWDINGNVDNYMDKDFALFISPVISVFVLLLFLFLPKIDPLKKNVDKFRKYYDDFILLMMCFLLYMHLLTLSWNLNYKFDFIKMMMPAFAVLFYYCGILIENAKRNWFIGIKTPWTLSSDVVWGKTHKLGGKLFKLLALICLLGILFPLYAFVLFIVALLVIVIFLFVYSYLLYKREK